MSSTLLMPCAGKSTRFNNTRPKWMLTHPNGNLMLLESLNGLDLQNVDRIIITVIKEHIEDSKINIDKLSNKIFKMKEIKPEFLILDNFTSSQSDTVYQTILKKNVTGPIFIKDCDNYFNSTITEQNIVCISQLQNNINAINKSYVSLDKYGYLSGIVEKKIIGNKFCVGGYSFKNAELFRETFEKLTQLKFINREIYISHIIQEMLISFSEMFEITEVENYADWGTLEDWEKYTSQFKTLFIDLDGVLVKNSSEYFQPEWGNSESLEQNIKIINDLYYGNKTTIIITTARNEEYRESTLQQLKKLGINYHRIIFGLPHAKRILINDYSNSNPYPSAIAINVQRNGDNLSDYHSNLSGRHSS